MRLLIFSFLIPFISFGQLAFPTAEGFGKNTTGGRGGTIIHVTNLNNSGAGSLREACEANGTRTIVFDVGGTIQLNNESSIQIGSTNFTENTAEENVTIAGETAPFPGITIRGGGIEIYTSNVIIRYITSRPNIETIEANDALSIRNWGVGGYDQSDIIIDHVSLSHGSDENFDTDGLSVDADLRRVTLQNSIIGENTQQGKAILRGSHTYELSILNNYITECDTRNPLIGYGAFGETMEFINNIIYGYESGAELSRGNNVDLISNVYESFASDPSQYNVITWASQGYGNAEGSGSVFVDGNFISGPKEAGASDFNTELLTYNEDSRVIKNSLVTAWETEKTAIENKLLPKVGNSLYRDQMDTDWINSYYNKDGAFAFTAVPSKTLATRPSSDDSDDDDMLDAAEIAVWGNITTTNAPLADTASPNYSFQSGYTNIEKTHFYLAGDLDLVGSGVGGTAVSNPRSTNSALMNN